MRPNKCRIMCPDCGRMKMLFETEKKAENFIKFNGEEISENISDLRVYYCPACCGYHISSKPYSKKYENKTNKLISEYYNDISAKENFLSRANVKNS